MVGHSEQSVIFFCLGGELDPYGVVGEAVVPYENRVADGDGMWHFFLKSFVDCERCGERIWNRKDEIGGVVPGIFLGGNDLDGDGIAGTHRIGEGEHDGTV